MSYGGPHFPPAIWRAIDAINEGVIEAGFGWFRPVTRYIVLRAARGGWIPTKMDGLWVNRPEPGAYAYSMAVGSAVASAVGHPTGRYERREPDGLLAEVYEFGPEVRCEG